LNKLGDIMPVFIYSLGSYKEFIAICKMEAKMTRITALCICFIAVGLMFVNVSYAIDPATCVGKWSLDEGNGDVVKDSSGTGNDGTILGGAEWVDGYFEKALEFKGSSTCVEVPNDPSLDGKEVTVMAWVKPSILSDDWNLIATKWFDAAGGDADADWHFCLRNSGGGVYKMNLYLTWDVQNVFANSEVHAEEWSHLAFTVNDSGDIRFYLNGILDGEELGTSGRADSTTSLLYISDPRPSHFGMIGIIDEVSVYNVALSEADIKNVMTAAAVFSAGKLTTTWAETKTK